MINIGDLKIGVTNELVQLETCEDNRLLATRLVQQCRRTLDIISRLLDPPLFDSPEFIEAVKNLVIKHRKSRIRIIVFEPDTIVKNGHRLVDLAGQLSSFIEFRKASEEFRKYNECLLLTDGVAYLHRINAERFEATANFYDRRLAKSYQREFNTMWEAGLQDPNLRRVSL